MNEYCGETTIKGEKYDVYVKNNQFKLFTGKKFVKFVKESALRVAGIFGALDKKMYGKHGYVGCLLNEVKRGNK